jgi:hypothetical protein
MEQQPNKYLSIGKQIWLKYFKWIIAGIVLLIGGIGYWIYYRGKKDTLAKVPDSVPYPPDLTVPTSAELGEFSIWVKNDCPVIANKLNKFFTEFAFSNADLNFIIKNELSVLSDKKLVYLNNYYNRVHYKNGKGSLVKDLNAVFYVWGNLAKEDRDNIVKRLNKLGAK